MRATNEILACLHCKAWNKSKSYSSLLFWDDLMRGNALKSMMQWVHSEKDNNKSRSSVSFLFFLFLSFLHTQHFRFLSSTQNKYTCITRHLHALFYVHSQSRAHTSYDKEKRKIIPVSYFSIGQLFFLLLFFRS